MTVKKPEVLIYLAAPYSHEDPTVRMQRYVKVTEMAIEIMRAGKGRVAVFSPITHSHPLALMGKFDLPGEWWLGVDKLIQPSCHELWVYCIPGWTHSNGIIKEVARAGRLEQTVRHLFLGESLSGWITNCVEKALVEHKEKLNKEDIDADPIIEDKKELSKPNKRTPPRKKR